MGSPKTRFLLPVSINTVPLTIVFYRFWSYLGIVLYCLVFPLSYLYFQFIDVGSRNPLNHHEWYLSFSYIIMMNILVVRLLGRYIISAIAYPFSNLCASKYLKKNLNAKFGGEFAKRIDHMAALLKTLSA
jgi:hypothetical protein